MASAIETVYYLYMTFSIMLFVFFVVDYFVKKKIDTLVGSINGSINDANYQSLATKISPNIPEHILQIDINNENFFYLPNGLYNGQKIKLYTKQSYFTSSGTLRIYFDNFRDGLGNIFTSSVNEVFKIIIESNIYYVNSVNLTWIDNAWNIETLMKSS